MGHIIAAVLLVAATAVYGLTTLSASVPRWIVLYAWAGLSCVAFLWFLWRQGWRGADRIDALALSLLSWMAFSLLWSADWQAGVFQLTNATALCCVFLWVRRYPDWIAEGATAAIIVGLVLQWLYPLDWGGHGNRNFQSEFLIIALCLGWTAKRKWAAGLWLLLLPVTAWYLAFGNPSKTEYLVVPALLLWGWYERRKLRQFGNGTGGIVVEQPHGVAGPSFVRPRAWGLR